MKHAIALAIITSSILMTYGNTIQAEAQEQIEQVEITEEQIPGIIYTNGQYIIPSYIDNTNKLCYGIILDTYNNVLAVKVINTITNEENTQIIKITSTLNDDNSGKYSHYTCYTEMVYLMECGTFKTNNETELKNSVCRGIYEYAKTKSVDAIRNLSIIMDSIAEAQEEINHKQEFMYGDTYKKSENNIHILTSIKNTYTGSGYFSLIYNQDSKEFIVTYTDSELNEHTNSGVITNKEIYERIDSLINTGQLENEQRQSELCQMLSEYVEIPTEFGINKIPLVDYNIMMGNISYNYRDNIANAYLVYDYDNNGTTTLDEWYKSYLKD